jgi:predicted PurR-regulated permease PerM
VPSAARVEDPERQRTLSRATDVAIRLGALAVLLGWCLAILAPFLLPIVWGAILSVALYGPFRAIARSLGGRQGLAATLFSLVLLTAIIVPSLMVVGSLADDLSRAAQAFRAGTLHVPPPPERVASWPVVGAKLYAVWLLASENLQAALTQAGPRLQSFAAWLLGAAGRLLLGVLQFLLAIIISGVLLAYSGQGTRRAEAIATRLVGERGPAMVQLAAATVRGVTRGILGVAVIQAILCGIGLFVAGVPAAGVWTLCALILAVIQVGVALVMIPATIWAFANLDTLPAVLFLIWTILLLPLDNILKPLLMGRGLDVPIVVIFLGAIGGFITQGIIGLFVGAVGLVLGYELWKGWLGEEPAVGA